MARQPDTEGPEALSAPGWPRARAPEEWQGLCGIMWVARLGSPDEGPTSLRSGLHQRARTEVGGFLGRPEPLSLSTV